MFQPRETPHSWGERGLVLPPGASQRGLLCIRLESTTPITVEIVSRAVVELGNMAQPGAGPVLTARHQVRCDTLAPARVRSMPHTRFACGTTSCSTRKAAPGCRPTSRRHSQFRRPGVGPPEGPTPHCVPRLCGARRRTSAGGRPALRRRVAVRLAVPRVRGASFQGGGGGLVTLPHARLLNGSQVHEHSQEHSLCVRVEPARGALVTAVNLHLPPALPAARRRAVGGDASTFVHMARASVKIVAGDFKKAQRLCSGRWLSKALGPKGPLAGFRAPYRPGDPMNVV